MHNFKAPRILSLIAVAAISFTACGGDDAASTTATAPADEAAVPAGEEGRNTVILSDSTFDQTELRVAVGTTVTWENTDAFAHTVTSDDGSAIPFDSGEIGEGETFEFTFEEAGEFPYFCQIHPTMQAIIIVE